MTISKEKNFVWSFGWLIKFGSGFSAVGLDILMFLMKVEMHYETTSSIECFVFDQVQWKFRSFTHKDLTTKCDWC